MELASKSLESCSKEIHSCVQLVAQTESRISLVTGDGVFKNLVPNMVELFHVALSQTILELKKN